MGFSTSFREVSVSFASDDLGEAFGTSKAVLGMLLDASLQPLSFQPMETTIQLFVRTTQEVAAGGAIRLEAPKGFDFASSTCGSLELDSHYYTEAKVTTLRLPHLNCSNFSSYLDSPSSNVALIRLKARLFAEQMYGWQMDVRAPSMSVFDDVVSGGLNYWRLYTENQAGSLVDGTPSPIPLIGQGSFRLHYRLDRLLFCELFCF